VTIEFSTRFCQPVPLDEEIRVIGRITNNKRRYFEGTGEIRLADGSVAVEGQGKFLKLSLDKIADFDVEAQDWRLVPSENDPQYVEI